MPEKQINPYQSPGTSLEKPRAADNSFVNLWQANLWVRLLWVTSCWFIGLIVILSGIQLRWVRTLGSYAPTVWVSVGFLFFMLGPIFWYFFRPASTREDSQISAKLNTAFRRDAGYNSDKLK